MDIQLTRVDGSKIEITHYTVGIGIGDEMNEQTAPIPPNTLRNADGTAFQAGTDMSKRIGIIRVIELILDEMGITIKLENGICQDADTLATVKERLLLPLDYTITSIFLYPIRQVSDRRVWAIAVEAPSLPVLDPLAQWPPIVTPIYTRSGSGPAQLLRIEVENTVAV